MLWKWDSARNAMHKFNSLRIKRILLNCRKQRQVNFLSSLLTWVIKVEVTYCRLDFCYETISITEPQVEFFVFFFFKDCGTMFLSWISRNTDCQRTKYLGIGKHWNWTSVGEAGFTTETKLRKDVVSSQINIISKPQTWPNRNSVKTGCYAPDESTRNRVF